jgi:hypothetical protein
LAEGSVVQAVNKRDAALFEPESIKEWNALREK